MLKMVYSNRSILEKEKVQVSPVSEYSGLLSWQINLYIANFAFDDLL